MTAQNDREGTADPTVSGPQSEAAIAPSPDAGVPISQGYTVLSEEQRRLLAAVLDCLVPARDGLPGAGSLGVDAAIDRTLAQTPRLRRVFLDGLAEIMATSVRQTRLEFPALDAAAQEAALRAVEEAQPAFFAALVDHAYRGYYTHPQVHAVIGYPGRAPQPQGHVLAPFREELLQLQRGRQPFWRQAGS